MLRAGGIATAAGGLLARTVLGLVGLALLFGWVRPLPGPGVTAATRPDDPAATAMTVMLQVPEGEVAKHLTVVDASGRELAVLTHWISGGMTMVSGRGGRVAVCYYQNTDGTVRMRVQGPGPSTLIDADPGGMTRVSQVPASPAPRGGAPVGAGDRDDFVKDSRRGLWILGEGDGCTTSRAPEPACWSASAIRGTSGRGRSSSTSTPP